MRTTHQPKDTGPRKTMAISALLMMTSLTLIGFGLIYGLPGAWISGIGAGVLAIASAWIGIKRFFAGQAADDERWRQLEAQFQSDSR